MLYLLKTKGDVLAMLYGLAAGRGMPRGAVRHLDGLIKFHPRENPTAFSTLQLLNADGSIASETKTPIDQPKMFWDPLLKLYQPELDDFEVEFKLPAMMYAVCETSFDRTGELEVAIFEAQPLVHLDVTYRYQTKREFTKFFINAALTPSDLGRDEGEINAQLTEINNASETEFRAMLSATLGRDLAEDAAWDHIMRKWQEIELWLTFIRGRTWADYEALLELRAKKMKAA